MDDILSEIYDLDVKPDGPSGRIQWKGTDVCMDIHCTCGYGGHVDTDFFYYYKCPECSQVYSVGAWVRLLPLTQEQVKYLKERGSRIHLEEEETYNIPEDKIIRRVAFDGTILKDVK